MFSLIRTDNNVHKATFKLPSFTSKQRCLIISDVHWDSAWCDRKVLTKHLDQAKASNSPIFMFGDFFDVMQGKWDPRKSYDQLRPEHQGPNYLDLLVNTASDYLMPYKEQLALIGYGNHETAIIKRHEVDLIQRLVGILRKDGSKVVTGQYWGFVQFVLSCSTHKDTKTLHYHHGYGGGGEVTRGLIDHSRTRGQYQADIYVSGHIHRRNMDENILLRCTTKGKIRSINQMFLRCSSYKHEDSGYHIEKGRAARPIGGWWLEFSMSRLDDNVTCANVVALPT